MSGPLRVLLAEPDEPTRMGIRMALEADGIEVCGEPLDAARAVALAVSERPDVCLVDEGLRGGAILAVDAIFRRLPDCKLLILTDSDEPKSLFAAIRAGASGYLRKDLDPRACRRRSAGSSAGEAALSRRLTQRLLDSLRTRERGRSAPTTPGGPSMTDRELEVLELMAEGLRTSEIAGAAVDQRGHRPSSRVVGGGEARRRRSRRGDRDPDGPFTSVNDVGSLGPLRAAWRSESLRAMSPDLAVMIERVARLRGARGSPPSVALLAEIDEVLTAGYARALNGDAWSTRTEERLHELIYDDTAPVRGRELRAIATDHAGFQRDLVELRAKLAELWNERNRLRAALGARAQPERSSTMPSRTAITAAWMRLSTPSFSSVLET